MTDSGSGRWRRVVSYVVCVRSARYLGQRESPLLLHGVVIANGPSDKPERLFGTMSRSCQSRGAWSAVCVRLADDPLMRSCGNCGATASDAAMKCPNCRAWLIAIRRTRRC